LEAAFFGYFLCGGKESNCRPAQGQRPRHEGALRMPAKNTKTNGNARAAKAPRGCQRNTSKKNAARGKTPPAASQTKKTAYLGNSECPIK
jgi:hypothetical protein